jgi:hypothetical protein
LGLDDRGLTRRGPASAGPQRETRAEQRRDRQTDQGGGDLGHRIRWLDFGMFALQDLRALRENRRGRHKHDKGDQEQRQEPSFHERSPAQLLGIRAFVASSLHSPR